MSDMSPMGAGVAALKELRASWAWYVGLGALLVVIGLVALGVATFTTIVSVVIFGWLLIFGGVTEAVYAFWRKRWGGFFIDLLTGLLYLVVGFLVVSNPVAGAEVLTLMIALFLMFGGILRAAAATALQPPHWIWLLVHGAVSLLLGILIWRQWPVSGLWAIGLFVGIEMIFNGWTLIMLGLLARNLKGEFAE